MKTPPAWYPQAIEALLAGASIAEAGRACNVRRETISRALSAPDSALRAELDRRREARAPVQSDQDLVAKALGVLEAHLNSGDKLAIDAAKIIVARLGPQASAQPELAPAEEVSPEQAIRELVATLPTVKVLLREHPSIPTAVVDELRQALQAVRAEVEHIDLQTC